MKKFITYILPFLSFLFSNQIYKISIEGTIDLGLPPYIERSIKEAEANGASAIIFEINTFGGRVDAATQIKDAILGTEILSVAYINRRAISAGALISLSCEKIYMSGGGLIGAATAVDMSGKKGSEKVISFMREEMASTAEKRGRNKEIARGMVDEELKFSYLLINGDSVKVEDIEGRKEGKLISLTTEQALKYKIADDTVENIDDTDVFCALTNADEANIISSMLAKRLGAKTAVALINRAAYVDLVQQDLIDIAISPQQTTIGSVLAHIRKADIVKVHSLRRGAAEAIEAAPEAAAPAQVQPRAQPRGRHAHHQGPPALWRAPRHRLGRGRHPRFWLQPPLPAALRGAHARNW